MLDWLWGILSSRRYRIIHDPELGYLPQAHESHDWQLIKEEGTLGVYGESAFDSICHGDWCKTEEEAGQRINRRSNMRGSKVIWEK